MSTFSMFRRRDPWWEVDGPAARSARRKRRFVAFLAFIAALTAIAFVAFAWTVKLGLAGAFGIHAALGLG